MAQARSCANSTLSGTYPSANCRIETSAYSVSAKGLYEGYTCGIDGNNLAKCWGSNAYTQLGVGDSSERHSPTAVQGLIDIPSEIQNGGTHVCALLPGKSLYCRGFNVTGQLGDGSTTSRSTPVAVSGIGGSVTRYSLGGAHSCAVLVGGDVKCWGYNRLGQVGSGDFSNHLTPVSVVGLETGAIDVKASGESTCALLMNRKVMCWGNFASSAPALIADLENVVQIDVGNTHACALLNLGGVKCWGANSEGQLGNGTTTASVAAVAATGLTSGVIAISTGSEHSCALKKNGSLYCWGRNFAYELGDGSNQSRNIPTPVSGLSSGVTAVSAGYLHSCAVINGVAINCWGSNSAGAVGDTTTTRPTPVSVGL